MKLTNSSRFISRLWNSSPRILFESIKSRSPFNNKHFVETIPNVWCLSTGRVGTMTLAELAGLGDDVVSHHEPKPKLYGLSRCFYELGHKEECNRILIEAVSASRDFRMNPSAVCRFESSPQATFLASVFQAVFAKNKFIHVVRHPAAVVRSGMRRGWFAGHSHDKWRIQPASGPVLDQWPEMSVLEKNIWLWAETNRWIEGFMKTLPNGRGVRLRSEDIFNGDTATLNQFYGILGVEVPKSRRIDRVLNKKRNKQMEGHFPDLSGWNELDRMLLEKHCGRLMELYGYSYEKDL